MIQESMNHDVNKSYSGLQRGPTNFEVGYQRYQQTDLTAI